MKRLDLLLFEKSLYNSREKAKQAIESARVTVDGKVITKPAFSCSDNAKIEVKPFEFVSRGGFKLQKAVEEFAINLTNKVVLDIGASTGGFTDVCLQCGAKKVYAVDTGEGQLNDTLKNDPRVVNLEKTNYLTLSKENLADVNAVVIDVSFISLAKLAGKLADDFLNAKTKVEIVALIKPQFEVGLDYARKHKGIVKDAKVHHKVIQNVTSEFENLGFNVINIIPSPIKGGDGNTEFLMYVTN